MTAIEEKKDVLHDINQKIIVSDFTRRILTRFFRRETKNWQEKSSILSN